MEGGEEGWMRGWRKEGDEMRGEDCVKNWELEALGRQGGDSRGR